MRHSRRPERTAALVTPDRGSRTAGGGGADAMGNRDRRFRRPEIVFNATWHVPCAAGARSRGGVCAGRIAVAAETSARGRGRIATATSAAWCAGWNARHLRGLRPGHGLGRHRGAADRRKGRRSERVVHEAARDPRAAVGGDQGEGHGPARPRSRTCEGSGGACGDGCREGRGDAVAWRGWRSGGEFDPRADPRRRRDRARRRTPLRRAVLRPGRSARRAHALQQAETARDSRSAGSAAAGFRSCRAGRAQRGHVAARGSDRSVAVAADARPAWAGTAGAAYRSCRARLRDAGGGALGAADARAEGFRSADGCVALGVARAAIGEGFGTGERSCRPQRSVGVGACDRYAARPRRVRSGPRLRHRWRCGRESSP